eukprot:CAMPEP_0167770026 /NCGR_PEP_ID=MMETSP0110_2-20121227/17669_1 /TAXON_ID=629695 /ORGANISM="Gymnochlora sp., Strain CCMP2014" /LENGTH=90 /DNA_ID=CAMNT_0007659115 /DNA_START=34 /DNA_END=303 /DNA_ORIENTATION=-
MNHSFTLGLSALVNVSLVAAICLFAFGSSSLASPAGVRSRTSITGFRPMQVQRVARNLRNMRVFDGEGSSEVSPERLLPGSDLCKYKEWL